MLGPFNNGFRKLETSNSLILINSGNRPLDVDGLTNHLVKLDGIAKDMAVKGTYNYDEPLIANLPQWNFSFPDMKDYDPKLGTSIIIGSGNFKIITFSAEMGLEPLHTPIEPDVVYAWLLDFDYIDAQGFLRKKTVILSIVTYHGTDPNNPQTTDFQFTWMSKLHQVVS